MKGSKHRIVFKICGDRVKGSGLTVGKAVEELV